MRLCKLSKKIKESAYIKTTEKKNRSMREAFSRVPFSERVIFVPHCLRNTQKCKAKESGAYYICAQCGECKINDISKISKELGYKGFYILKGGKILEKFINELSPKGVIGIACYFEGEEAFKMLKSHKDIAVQFVPLCKDGCSDTDVELKKVVEILTLKK